MEDACDIGDAPAAATNIELRGKFADLEELACSNRQAWSADLGGSVPCWDHFPFA